MSQTVFELPSGWESVYDQPNEQQGTGSSQTVFELPSTFGTEGINYQPERNIVSDILHNLWAGSGEALDIWGRGFGSDTLQNAGEYIAGTSYAQPDISERAKQLTLGEEVAGGAARSIPMSLPIMAAGIGGTFIGTPAVGIGAATGASAVLFRGLKSKALERWEIEHPGEDIAIGESYSTQSAMIDAVTELASVGADIFTAKLGGQLTKQGIRAAMTHNMLGSVEDIIGQQAKKIGATEFLTKVVGASSVGGASEVAAEKLQYELDNKYDIKTEAPDYFKTFLIGAVAEAPFNVGANILEAKNRDKIHDNLTKGLSSEDVEQRKHTANQIYETMYKASPEAAQTWKDYAELHVEERPLYLEELVTKDSSWKLNIKKQEQAGVLNQITTDPTSILKEAGIPTSSNVYGSSPTAPPPLSTLPGETGPIPAEERDVLLEKIAASGKVRKEAQFSTQIPGPDYIAPYDPYSMSKAMGEVEPGSNNVVTQPIAPSRFSTLQGKKKLNITEKKELKDLQAVVEIEPKRVAVVEPVLPKEEPVVIGEPLNVSESKVDSKVDPEDLIYSAEDLKGLSVKILKGKTKSGKLVYKNVEAHTALKDIDEEIRLYEDIMRCASK